MRIEEMSIQDIIKDIGPLTEIMTPEQWGTALKRVWLEGTEKDAEQFLDNAYAYLKKKCEESKTGEAVLFGDASPEEVKEVNKRAAREIAATWKKQNEAAEAKKLAQKALDNF